VGLACRDDRDIVVFLCFWAVEMSLSRALKILKFYSVVCWDFDPVSIVHQHSEMIEECDSRSYPSTRRAALFYFVY
jgi:hypothetical protein